MILTFFEKTNNIKCLKNAKKVVILSIICISYVILYFFIFLGYKKRDIMKITKQSLLDMKCLLYLVYA